jgi:molybdopterin converting factor subunit 1
VSIQLLYFGILKDILGREQEALEITDAATVEELVRLLRARASNRNDAVWDALAVAVNREYAGTATILRDGDEVALLPPVSGGTE